MNKIDGRLILVSNRLPVVFNYNSETQSHGFAVSSGGLATGLSSVHSGDRCLWVGWPGEFKKIKAAEKRDLLRDLAAQNFVSVELSTKDLSEFYFGFSNSILWPLFHYLLDLLPVHLLGWDTYKEVNQKYADAIIKNYREGDVIWVHDYQLMLVPAMLRQHLPNARIGFFLHIPFPSYEIFRILPWREEILRGLLGADVIGFHTQSYLRHFANCLLRIVGTETNVDRCQFEGREVMLGVYPMGIDVKHWNSMANDPALQPALHTAKANANGLKTLLAVDRLDYTKGIVRRLKAFAMLLKSHPELRGQIMLMQVAVPSRTEVQAYRDLRREVEELVGQINGEFGAPFYQPIQYVYRGISPTELAVLYRSADVMLVTPMRDGMNLVAKEFIACRNDERGVLVLSEFAGAASELGEAIVVNPYNLEEMVAAFRQAIAMEPEEQAVRMSALRRRVKEFDNGQWAQTFVDTLVNHTPLAPTVAEHMPPYIDPVTLATELAQYQKVLILCDYDGTLVPIADLPKLAKPDTTLQSILADLAGSERISMHIVSGRSQTDLEHWFADTPIGLHAEHGFWYRPQFSSNWTSNDDLGADVWKQRVRPIFERFVKDARGSFIEDKTCALAWHYRMCDVDVGNKMAKELRFHLHEATANLPVNVLLGKKVIEVRHLNCNKGAILKRLLETEGEFDHIVALGDDTTDEDLFKSLPPQQTTIYVGRSPSKARYRFNNPFEVRVFLQAMLHSSHAPRTERVNEAALLGMA